MKLNNFALVVSALITALFTLTFIRNGYTLIEVIIALSILVVFFLVFSLIFTWAGIGFQIRLIPAIMGLTTAFGIVFATGNMGVAMIAGALFVLAFSYIKL